MIGEGDARDARPDIFKIYLIEPDLVNGKVHYTSQDGTKAIAFESSLGEWNIQTAESR